MQLHISPWSHQHSIFPFIPAVTINFSTSYNCIYRTNLDNYYAIFTILLLFSTFKLSLKFLITTSGSCVSKQFQVNFIKQKIFYFTHFLMLYDVIRFAVDCNPTSRSTSEWWLCFPRSLITFPCSFFNWR